MSVILNLLTCIPVLGQSLLLGILGGPYTSTPSLAHILTLHLILAILASVLASVHILVLHRLSPGSDAILDLRSTYLADVLSKDAILAAYTSVLLLHVNIAGLLIHPDSSLEILPTTTPRHIEPEPYFL